jgi:hypothetical protein
MRQLATVKYQIGTYSGTRCVNCDSNDDKEWICNKAKAMIKREYPISMPMYYEHYEVIERRDME